MDRFDEAYQTVRGEMRYVALYATDYGAIEVVITRSDDNAKPDYYGKGSSAGKAGLTDHTAQAFTFHPEAERRWRFVASLLYYECESRDVPMHNELSEKHIEALRADSGKLVARTVAILSAHTQVEAAAA